MTKLTQKKTQPSLEPYLKKLISKSRKLNDGKVADYIPELANVDTKKTSITVMLKGGDSHDAGDANTHKMTLQSVSKLIILIGLLEEFGKDKVLSWVGVEPTGQDFASIKYLDWHGPKPSNPFVNSGAICLCDKIPGNLAERWHWIDKWVTKLFNQPLYVNQSVYNSELITGDHNRALAYLLKSTGFLNNPVESVLKTYVSLCSLEVTTRQAAYLPALLARSGCEFDHKPIISSATVDVVLALMATCGLYDESGYNLVMTGLPAKSGVSGLIVAVALNRAGIAVASPRVDYKGGSIRGQYMLEQLSNHTKWHFANAGL